jgi:hypothetical protein
MVSSQDAMLSLVSSLKRCSSFQSTLCLTVLVVVHAPNPSRAAGHGIHFVRATKETILLTGSCDHATIQIIELRPQQSAHPTNFSAALATVATTSKFTARVPRFDGARDRLFSSFLALREDAAGATTPLGTNRFVEDMTDISVFNAPFPKAASKKGLQVQMVDDALALGIKHAALNVNFSQMIDLGRRTNSPVWSTDGQSIHFHRSYIESLDRQVRPLTEAGVVVSLILLAYQSGDPGLNRILLHPDYDKAAPNRLGAFNTVTAEGVLHFRACVEFLAHRFGDPSLYRGRVANFILGNEVNSHWFWANRGRVSMEIFVEDFLRTARIAATALRKISSSARLYLSLEHHWNVRYAGGDAEQAFAGRPFLDYFSRRAREQGDFDWHLAFHPYPENLFEPRTWNDKSATTNDNTPRITFKNLEMLTRYMNRPEMLYRGQPRRIILSEQGFHTPDKPEGELWQAAAYAYAYYKAANLPGIDSFILHRHVDHGAEGGLNLGLWTRNRNARSAAEPAKRKLSYEVFKAADTVDWRRAFEFARPVIGIQNWEEILSP